IIYTLHLFDLLLGVLVVVVVVVEKYPDITGDETRYSYDYRKYTRKEIETICDGMKTSALYKPDAMVKIERQLGEGVFRKTPNREWMHHAPSSPTTTAAAAAAKKKTATAATTKGDKATTTTSTTVKA
ncbi:La ribonucleoprotein domain member 4B, partial [Perkinsus olseni]